MTYYLKLTKPILFLSGWLALVVGWWNVVLIRLWFNAYISPSKTFACVIDVNSAGEANVEAGFICMTVILVVALAVLIRSSIVEVN